MRQRQLNVTLILCHKIKIFTLILCHVQKKYRSGIRNLVK